MTHRVVRIRARTIHGCISRVGLYPNSVGLGVSTAMSILVKKKTQPAVRRGLGVLQASGTGAPLELMHCVPTVSELELPFV